jgi:hypothetical protein
MLIGERVAGIKRIDNFWSVLDDIDLFVFPDVYDGPLQEHLVSLGKRVWGGRCGEELELCRPESKEHLKKLGIDIGPYQVIKGLDALREYLKAHDDQYVKISRTRGDMETFHSESYGLIEPKLDELEYTLGAKKKIMEFVVEEAINDAVEIGYDGWTIDGRFTKNCMTGVEVKDKGLVMKTLKYDALPDEVRGVNDKLASTFQKYGYRGFFSSEIRITRDLKSYVIDPCARMGSPPGELFQLMVKNWADIIWNGAAGEIVEPVFAAKWGAELLLLSSWADLNWQSLTFPRSIRENVKLRNLTVIEGKYYVVPQSVGLPEIGAVVATGDTMDAAIKEVRRLADLVRGHYIEVVPDSLDEAKDQFEKLKEFGIKI